MPCSTLFLVTRASLLAMGVVATLAACSTGSTVTTSSGGSSGSSGSSSGSSGSGTLTTTTTCAPLLDAKFFDNATTAISATAANEVCPAGYRLAGPSGSGRSVVTPPKRVTSEAELVKDYCVEDLTASDAGGADGGRPGIDFATSYVLAVTHSGFGSSAAVLAVGAERWVRIDGGGGCGGADPGTAISFFVVPNGTDVKSQTCSASCTCTGGTCEYPP